MGLIKAALGATGGVLADQWREYFYCDAIPTDVLAVKGYKKVTGRSSNTKGEDNIITNGSVIAIADGQCMMIVEQGKIVDICAEPGEFIYDMSTEPSVFTSTLGDGIRELFYKASERFEFGGLRAKDQRVYYFNTKEIRGNKFGTAGAVPFRVVDKDAGINMDIGIKCFGEYTFKIVNPLRFYTNVCGNFSYEFGREELEGNMRNELLSALQPAFARLSQMGVTYSSILLHVDELEAILKEELTTEWKENRGIEIGKVSIASVKANEEDERTIKEMQKNAAFMDPTRAAAYLVGSQGKAMQDAANNAGGRAVGFMGMNMAAGGGGINAGHLFQMGMNQPKPQPQPDTYSVKEEGWVCEKCGRTNTGKFCMECGEKKPEPKQADGWKCPNCGTENAGKFCAECGTKKPEPVTGCPNCGWKPTEGTAPGKFCPECGTKL